MQGDEPFAGERDLRASWPNVRWSGGTVSAVITDLESPNGLAFSPDERILYADNTRLDDGCAQEKERGEVCTHQYIRAYDVAPDGTLSNSRIFANMHSAEDGVPDGMKVDTDGRVYCTGAEGVWVFEHYEDTGNVKSKEFFSTERVAMPISSYHIKEGDDLPVLAANARNYVVLEGKSAWITKIKKKYKEIAHIKVKPTDRINSVNRDYALNMDNFLEKEFEPVAGVTKEEIKEFLKAV